MKTTRPLHASERQLAALFDMDREALARAVREAGIPRTKDGYDVKAVLELLVGNGALDKMAPSARAQLARARFTEMRLAEKARQLIPVQEVERGYATLFKIVAHAFETLPDTLERDCGLSPAMLGRLEGVLDEARRRLHAEVNAPEAPASGN